MKRSFLLPLLLIAGLFSARAQETYFTIDDMPDLVKCLPAPPDTTSLDFAHDVMRYMWGKTMRADAARAAIAARDAIWDLDTLAAIFSEPFGVRIDKEKTPEIYKAFVQGVHTIELIRIRPKAHFMRKRPFDRFQEHMYTTWEEDLWTYSQTHPDGFTLNISTWEEPREGIAVAYDATQEMHGKADLEYVVSHAQAHGGFVGGWQDTKSGQYYFDSVRIFPVDSLAQARQFGRENQQKAIYNLSTGKEIRLPVRRAR